MTNLIQKYFPEITEKQLHSFEKLPDLYSNWNEKINVISRKDIDSLLEKHVLHSLGIAKVMQFAPSTKVLDIGTGGGFPGIPLAILFPESQFTLADSIGKKIRVVNEIAQELQLDNVIGIHTRAEKIKEKFDFVVSRAVTQMPVFMSWIKGKFTSKNINSLQNGVLYLKGGDLTEELKNFPEATLYELKDYFDEEFFKTKKVVYIKNMH
ncbi:16S rRNA (guanine(527)-N(7))-methyltransferase RsmG [Apibacter sp. ESL0432]|uniref:16S rRNA (guanine(527)-N(7))-methyltransferase RsmG n=1 Tax=Apibacter sp. ESL0432 TaxID=2704652 RepID=UPI001C69B9CA|nr:16S rRNA (guanine(527)-N(7))-methyltransferase RsmG [Apibacter sp. ESL0432]QYN48227.1 16S rRNA (guanine(527)-N(7))-methyltransferase RsmG [Apibacter sp. ESL0432]